MNEAAAHVALLLIHLCFAMRIHEPRALPKPQIPATLRYQTWSRRKTIQ